MALPVNSIVQVSYRGVAAGQVVMLVTNWRVTSNTSVNSNKSNLTEIINRFKLAGAGDFRDTYLDLLPQGYTLAEVRAQLVSPTREAYVNAFVSVNGFQVMNMPTTNVAAVVSRHTALAGRKQISNSHLGPLGVGEYGNGTLGAGFIARLDAWGARWSVGASIVDGGNINIAPTIWHTEDVIQPSDNLITGWHVMNTVRVVRRRTVGLGI